MEKAWSRCLPVAAHFELTFRCNHDCVFCYNTREDEAGKKEMDLSDYRNAFRKVKELEVLFVTLTGGEPLCRKDFFKIAEAAKEEMFALRIFTNGYLIDEETARKISLLKPLEIEISIHGARSETHDRVTRIKGSFERMLKAVEELRKLGVKVNLKSLITRFNQEELEGIRDIARERGCSISFDPVVSPRDNGELSPLEYAPDADHLKKFWTEIYPGLKNSILAPLVEDNCTWAVCGIGRASLAIDPYGDIFPCIQWREKITNIKEVASLKEVWQNSPVLGKVRDIAARIKEEVLDKVEFGNFCSYCPAMAAASMGDPFRLYPQSLENARNLALAYQGAQKARKNKI
ncbi:MAG: radical SAM protein [Acidobacteriota bacterium]